MRYEQRTGALKITPTDGVAEAKLRGDRGWQGTGESRPSKLKICEYLGKQGRPLKNGCRPGNVESENSLKREKEKQQVARQPKKSRPEGMPSRLEKRAENWIPQTRLQGLRTGPEDEGKETKAGTEEGLSNPF